MIITIKPNFLIRFIAGETILIGAGEQIDFSQMLMLNDTAVFLIKKLQEHPATLEELTRQLVDAYTVNYSEAYNDIKEVTHQLEELGIITIKE